MAKKTYKCRNRIGNILLGIAIVLFSYWIFTNKINDINIKEDLKEENKKLDSVNIRMEIQKEELKEERNIIKEEIKEIKKEEENEKIQIDKQTDTVVVSYFLDYINEYKRSGSTRFGED